jgi:hypothetical protein
LAQDSAPPVDLAIQPSRRLAALIFLSHALALGAAAYAPMPRVLLAAAGATVLTSFIVLFRRHAMRVGRLAVRRLNWTAEGRWQVEDGEGAMHASELLPEPTVGPPLTILRLKDAGGTTRSALLFDDACDREQLRRLRARLRLG